MASALAAFLYSRAISIVTTSGGANTSTTLTNFPVCVVVNSTSWTDATVRGHFFSAGNTNGKRVQFFSGTTNLPYEVEFYDGTSAVYWVQAPSIPGNTTTVITVAYGNDPNGSAQDNATGVWDSSHKTVMHLSDGTTLSVADSTSNGNNGTNHSGAAAAGIADGGVNFDAATKYITVAGVPSGSNARTIEGWIKTSATGTKVLYDQGAVAGGRRFLIYTVTGTNYITVDVNGGSVHGTTNIRNGAWHHFAVTFTGTTVATTILIYVDGVVESLTVGNGTRTVITDATPMYLNSNVDGNTVGEIGTYDEFRVSNAVRAADWIKAEYFSAKTTSWPGDGWLTLGAETASSTPRSQAVYIG